MDDSKFIETEIQIDAVIDSWGIELPPDASSFVIFSLFFRFSLLVLVELIRWAFWIVVGSSLCHLGPIQWPHRLYIDEWLSHSSWL